GSRALQLAHVLRVMAAATRHRDLEIGLPEHRIEDADWECERRRRRVASRRAIELEGTSDRIAHHVERLPRHDAGDLVLAMAVRRPSREDRTQAMGAERAQDVSD